VRDLLRGAGPSCRPHLDLIPAVKFERLGLRRPQPPEQHVLLQRHAPGVDELVAGGVGGRWVRGGGGVG
jgi:hypothetical protein